MVLYAYPMDRTGCGFYRMVWPLRALRSHLASRIVWPGEDAGMSVDFDRGGSVTGVTMPADCSAVLLQRPTDERLVQAIPYVQALGIPVLVDVDDDLLALSPRHPAALHLHPTSRQRMPGHSARAVLDACQRADLVIASTPAILERYAPHGRGVLLRNRLRSDWASCLQAPPPGLRAAHPHTAPRVSAPHNAASPLADAHVRDVLASTIVANTDDPGAGPGHAWHCTTRTPYAHISSCCDGDDGDLTLGWPGTISTHPDDLAVLSRTLPLLPRTSRHRFTIVGPELRDPRRLRNLLGVDSQDVSFTGPHTFADWLPAIRHTLDVGVAPLEPSRFNTAKSWLKPLELAGSGVPFVASPTDEYRALGAGLIPSGSGAEHKGFHRYLKALLTSPALRAEERERNFAIARANTYAVHRDEWLDALSPYTERVPAVDVDRAVDTPALTS